MPRWHRPRTRWARSTRQCDDHSDYSDGLLALIHAAIDFLKGLRTEDGIVIFCVDQAAHLLSVIFVASLLPTAPLHSWRIVTTLGASPLLYLYAGGYIAVVLGGGHFVQRISGYFLKRIDGAEREQKPGIPEVGKYIGWLERSLILTFLLLGRAEVIGFLVGAKAVIRYPEMKGDDKGHFADYFLLGTMTSVGLALAGGLILIQVARIL
jgi:hypothetical protein